MQTEIIFYDKDKNPVIQNVTNWTTEDIEKLIAAQRFQDREEYHIRSGEWQHCQMCGAGVVLSPVSQSNLVCDYCQDKANINRNKLAKAYR